MLELPEQLIDAWLRPEPKEFEEEFESMLWTVIWEDEEEVVVDDPESVKTHA